jgi:hypothetical protein
LAYGVAGDVQPFAYGVAGEVSPFAGGVAGQAEPLAQDLTGTVQAAGGPLVHDAATGVQDVAESVTPTYLPGAAHGAAYGI